MLFLLLTFYSIVILGCFMKSYLFIISIICAMLFISCSEDFNLNGPVKDIYVLNCILQNDNTTQFVTLTKNIYTESGEAPSYIPVDKYVKNAIVKIFNKNTSYLLRDTIIYVTENSITSPVYCYYIKDLTITSGSSISIEAITPDGTILQSSVSIPEIKFENFTYRFPGVFMAGFSYYTSYNWGWQATGTFISFPKVCIKYKKFENGKYVENEAFVPVYSGFIENSDGTVTGIPIEPTANLSCQMTIQGINKTLKSISGDDPIKSNYTITQVHFYIIGLDPSLSRYYTSLNTYENSFTIKIKPTDYTNIKGGIGIFGVRYKYTRQLLVDSLYIRSFGYNYKPQTSM